MATVKNGTQVIRRPAIFTSSKRNSADQAPATRLSAAISLCLLPLLASLREDSMSKKSSLLRVAQFLGNRLQQIAELRFVALIDLDELFVGFVNQLMTFERRDGV